MFPDTYLDTRKYIHLSRCYSLFCDTESNLCWTNNHVFPSKMHASVSPYPISEEALLAYVWDQEEGYITSTTA